MDRRRLLPPNIIEWRNAIEQAREGDAAQLLHMLLYSDGVPERFCAEVTDLILDAPWVSVGK